LKGFVFVEPDGFKKEMDLAYWLQMGIEFVDALPKQKSKQPLKRVQKKKPDKQTKFQKDSTAANKPKKK